MKGRTGLERSVAATILAGLLAGCAPTPTSPSPQADLPPEEDRRPASRVHVVAIDGGTWEVLDPLLAAGRMPNLKALTERGARGVLRSMDPTASAIVWTTIATGKLPERHGIRSFVAETPQGKVVPVTSTMRRVKALWNIASESGLTVGFLGWWVSWPAESVRGYLGTDYAWPLRKDARGFATGVESAENREMRTYPPDLLEEIGSFVKTEATVGAAELDALGISAIPPVQGYAVRDMVLKDISLGDMQAFLLERYRPDLSAVYFDGFDAYCHLFWPVLRRFLDARAAGAEALAAIPPQELALAEAMEAHLARIDAYIGAVAAHASATDTVLVISDHGYGDNPGGKPVQRGYDEWIEVPHWHDLDGIVVAAGGPIRKGATIEGMTVLDVTPTILVLLGLPVAADMDGKPATGMLTRDFLTRHPVRSIPTYETERRGEGPIESPYDREVLDRLRTLGYIE